MQRTAAPLRCVASVQIVHPVCSRTRSRARSLSFCLVRRSPMRGVRQISRLCTLGLVSLVAPLFGQSPGPSILATNPPFNANRLKPGAFEYRMMKRGSEIAKFTVTVAKLPNGNFHFTGEAAGFNQNWESIATPLFHPISAMLRMQRKDGKMYSMNLKYDGDRVTGSQQTEPSASSKIDSHIPAGMVDQRIDWAAVMASDLEIGAKLHFTVFDPATGVSAVTGETIRAERVTVPAGTYDVVRVIYEIAKSKGTERYEVLATKSLPRMMVREDFPNGTSSELVMAK